MVQPFWKTVWHVLKILKTLLLQHPAIQLLKYYTTQENQTHKPTQNLYTNIYSSNIYNSPKGKNNLYAHQLMNGSAQEASPHSVCVCVLCVCAQSCLTLCDPMDCRPWGSSTDEIFQARILECVAISYFRGSSRRKDQTWVLHWTGGFFTTVSPRYLQQCSLSIKIIRQCGCLENILLNERNKSHKKPHILWFYLYEMSRKSKFMKTKSRSVLTTD